VTVAEIIRGETAMEFEEAVHQRQTRLIPENVLARVRLYKARGAPGDKPWELSAAQFSTFSEDSKLYDSPTIAAPQSGLKPSLRSGDTLEFWLAFVVAKSYRKPVMTFNPGSAWFHLY
jgi:hypothetical protein